MWEAFPVSLMSDSAIRFIESLAGFGHQVFGIELDATEEIGIIQLTPITILFALFLLMTFTIMVLRAHYRTKRHNELLIARLEYRAQNIALKQLKLQEQHQLTKEKSRQLLASLNYAKHIQTAVLPNETILKRFFPTSFAILESKEVVSGDFYWVAEKYDTTYLAVVDCTGHGVPGAFMSLMARSMLQDVIQNKGVLTTSNILDELRKCVLESFKEVSERTSEGMDMSLCSYNRNSRVLCFSGANQSLFIIRNGDNPLEDIRGKAYTALAEHDDTHLFLFKADRQPIGISHGPLQPFTTYTAKIQPGDRIFAFTDGFRDQFGGSNNKRLKSQRFRNLILSSQHLEMKEQRKQLLTSFHTWKGDEDQIDDMCVVGVQF